MVRALSAKTNLASLRREAKRWLKALEAGDAKATARFTAITAKPPAEHGLREVQHALALEYGFESWALLAARFAERPLPNVTQSVTSFLVADMAASLRFYVDGLSFNTKITWTPDSPDRIRWCWLELGGAALMLQELNPQLAPKTAPGLCVSVYFMCRDALAVYRDAIGRGLTPKRPFVGNAMWVVEFADPDGFQISFESPTKVPEGTEYDPAVHE